MNNRAFVGKFVSDQFRSLAAECASRGVLIQSLCPGFVTSKLSGIRKSSLFSPTPEQFVRSAIDRISLPFTTGYWAHEIQVNSKDLTGTKEIDLLLIIVGFGSINFTGISLE